jgi:hypothetical protein
VLNGVWIWDCEVQNLGLGDQPVTQMANLFEEVQQEISTQYWNYVAHKVNTFEQTELWPIPGRTLEK